MTVMFGGEVAYLCWAINEPFVNEVSFPEKTRRALPKVKVYRNPSRSSWIEHFLPDRPVLFAGLAFRRGDVFRTTNKK